MILSRRSFLSGLTIAGLGVGVGQPSFAGGRLKVVATTGMVADAVRQIGGDRVDVKALMGPGVDPHSYRQTRSDIVAMTRADLVIWHGLYLEAQMEDFFGKLGVRRAVVPVADGVDRALLIEHPSYADKFDPHVWMHPGLWVDVLAVVRDTLVAAMPGAEAEIRENAARHIDEIRALDAFATRVLDTIPEQNRVLMTAHDAFGYFGRAYDIEVLGIQGISTQSEAGLNRIGQMVDMLVERKISAVFVESSVSDRNIRALIEGAQAKGHKVRIGGELYSDAMGPIDSYEGSYLGMLDHNITVIAAALGGDVPPRGMHDKLTVGM